MAKVATNNLEYLVTRLHARRSRMAEAERLDALCRLRTSVELGQALYPGTDFPVLEGFQRRLAQDLVQELAGCRRHLGGAGQEFIDWQLAWFQMENLKVVLRSVLNDIPRVTTRPYLVFLPSDQGLNLEALAEAGSVEDFVARLPPGKPRRCFEEMLARSHDGVEPFLLEASLDYGYYQELVGKVLQFSDDEKEFIKALVFQEVNFFQLMLVVRGKFHHDLTAEELAPLRVAGSGVPENWFKNLLAAPDISAMARLSLGIVLDALPDGRGTGEPPTEMAAADVESQGWKRLMRLANSAFRRSHMGLGAVAAYSVLRRLEVANLITLSEGIRLGMDSQSIRGRLVPYPGMEVAHV